MQMFLWDGHEGGPRLASSFDNGVIAHEYCHGLTNRLTGGPGTYCLYNTEQAGEGWSDFCYLFVTSTSGTTITRGSSPYAGSQREGIYVEPYSPDWRINWYTYGQAKDLSTPHGIGFFFATVLWEMDLAMVKVYGFSPNVHDPTAGGNTMAFQLVVQGLKLQPCTPTFPDSRDAILLADEQINDGANRCLIWGVFARRGLGVNAVERYMEDFDVPDDCVNFRCEQFWIGPKVPPLPEYTYEKLVGCAGDHKLSTEEFAPWVDSYNDSCARYEQYDWCSEYGGIFDNFNLNANEACCACGGGEDNSDGLCQDIDIDMTKFPWVDEDDMSCQWYVDNNECAARGGSFTRWGLTANQVCCGCGGGDVNSSGTCVDLTADLTQQDWVDGFGDSCVWYGEDATRCATYGGLLPHPFLFTVANDACCACGGGDSQFETTTLDACPEPQTESPSAPPQCELRSKRELRP
jgi:hypothetical protein